MSLLGRLLSRFVSLGVLAIVLLLIQVIARRHLTSFFDRELLQRKDPSGPIIPLWDEEKRLCSGLNNSGRGLCLAMADLKNYLLKK